MSSIKHDLIGEQLVKGNLTTALQTYRIYYYPKELNRIDKVWIYFNRKEKDKLLGIKSLCFSSVETHRKFILNNLIYNLYLLEKRSEEFKPSFMGIEEYRVRLMEAVFNDLRNKLISKLKELRENELKVKCQNTK